MGGTKSAWDTWGNMVVAVSSLQVSGPALKGWTGPTQCPLLILYMSAVNEKMCYWTEKKGNSICITFCQWGQFWLASGWLLMDIATVSDKYKPGWCSLATPYKNDSQKEDSHCNIAIDALSIASWVVFVISRRLDPPSPTWAESLCLGRYCHTYTSRNPLPSEN